MVSRNRQSSKAVKILAPATHDTDPEVVVLSTETGSNTEDGHKKVGIETKLVPPIIG